MNIEKALEIVRFCRAPRACSIPVRKQEWDGFEIDETGAVVGYWLRFKNGNRRCLKLNEKTDLRRCRACGKVSTPRNVMKCWLWNGHEYDHPKGYPASAGMFLCRKCAPSRRKLHREAVNAYENRRLLIEMERRICQLRKQLTAPESSVVSSQI